MTTYYKATRPDGTDFRTGTINYGAAFADGTLVTHPDPHRPGVRGYLSVSVSPTNCTGAEWPCNLYEVLPGDPWTPNANELPSKRACYSLRVVRQLSATDFFGPQGVHVAALIEQIRALTLNQARQLAAQNLDFSSSRGAVWSAATARDAARDAAWDAAWVAWSAAKEAAKYSKMASTSWSIEREITWAASLDPAWYTVKDAVSDASWGLLVRDLLPTEQYNKLTLPWRTAIGPIHPDDPDFNITSSR